MKQNFADLISLTSIVHNLNYFLDLYGKIDLAVR